MKRTILLLLALCYFIFTQSQEVDYDSLERFINRMITDFELQGLAVGIVKDGQVDFTRGYGVREMEKPGKVDENTIFGIGSISKSFTALTVGILVSEGKLDWDDKVVKYLPELQLYDEYVTANYTIRDLLTHRSGLPSTSGGTLWYHSDLSREEVIHGLRYLKPEAPFRYKPAYQNVMFLVAGEIVARVSGMSWDDFLEQRVLKPLKMTNTTSRSSMREANPNMAQPHILDENLRTVVIEQEKGDNLVAAGFIYSSVNDMGNYMTMLLNGGVFKGDTLVSPEVMKEIWTPQIIYPLFGPPFHNEFTSYGFGWWLTPKNSDVLIEHSGGIDGMGANLVMLKNRKFGAVVLSNKTSEPASFLTTFNILGQVLQDSVYNIYSRFLSNRAERATRLEKRNQEREDSRIKGTRPSLELPAYAGTYFDKMVGAIYIKQKGEELELVFSHTGLFSGSLIHWHYDTFQVDWYDPRIPNGYLTFEFDSKQHITGFNLDQPDLLDVNFKELEIKRRD